MSKSIIELRNVTLSYPHLFKPKLQYNKIDSKYEAEFLLHKVEHKAEIEKINQLMRDLLVEKKANITLEQLASKNNPLKDGDAKIEESDKDRSYLADCFYIRAVSSEPIKLVNKNPSVPVVESDQILRGGNKVNAVIDLFYYNKLSKGFMANLKAVQYKSQGTPFGKSDFSVDQYFSNIEENEEADFDNDMF